jgi:hypothetical protein
MAVPQSPGLEFVVLNWMATESTSTALECFRNLHVAKFWGLAVALLASVPLVERAATRVLEWQSQFVVPTEETNVTSG